MKALKSQAGIGLIEVMVAAGIVAVISLAISSAITNLFQSTRAVEFRAEALSLTTDVRQLLDSTATCERNFGSPTGPGLRVQLTNNLTSLVDASGNTVYTTAAGSNAYGNRTVSLVGIQFGPTSYGGVHPSPSTFEVPLTLTYQVVGSASGPPQITRVINVHVRTLAGGVVDECSTGRMSNFLQESLAGNGYVVFPNGLMMQWGRTTVSANGISVVSFPTSFTNSVYSVVVTGTADTGNNAKDNWPTLYRHPSATTLNSFRVMNANDTSDPVGWFAIGR